MQCAAVTKSCRKCRGYGTEVFKGVYLCHRHEDFYDHCDKPLQMVRRYSSIFQTEAQRNATRDMLKVADYIHGDIFGLIGLDMITDLWADPSGSRWSHRDKADHIYQQFLEAGILKPCAHYDLWIRGLKRQTRTLLHTLVEHPAHTGFVRRHIADMLVAPYLRGVKVDEALIGLLHIAHRPIFNFTNQVPLDRQIQLYQEFLEYAFTLTNNRKLIGQNIEADFWEEVQQHPPHSLLKNKQLQEWILAHLRALKGAERMKRRREMDRLREEMMMAAWAPARISRWLDAGLEIEEL